MATLSVNRPIVFSLKLAEANAIQNQRDLFKDNKMGGQSDCKLKNKDLGFWLSVI
jgi:hypothetical protein